MRRKRNLGPRFLRCSHLRTDEPSLMRGRWLEAFPAFSEIHLEIGCGKGTFTAETAKNAPKILHLAIEIIPEAIIVAMETAAGENLSNVQYICANAADVAEYFGPGEVSRIYINFCDPWPKNRNAKRRLTSPEYLAAYAPILSAAGEIHFKTDNGPLFDYSLEQFQKCGFNITELSRDLHADGVRGVMTDYEKKFYAHGAPIYRCVAVRI